MKKFQRGQIGLAHFDPSFGHEYKKVRPALVIQHDIYPNKQAIDGYSDFITNNKTH